MSIFSILKVWSQWTWKCKRLPEVMHVAKTLTSFLLVSAANL